LNRTAGVPGRRHAAGGGLTAGAGGGRPRPAARL